MGSIFPRLLLDCPEIDSAQWAVAFSHDFGPAFWEEGPHVYQLLLDCPEIGEASVEGEFIAFAARGDFPTLESSVHLRLSGVSTTTMGPPDLLPEKPVDVPVRAPLPG